MKQIAKFEIVSKEQFIKAMPDDFRFTAEEVEAIYNRLQKPTRSTTGSAGYDFKSPFAFDLRPGESIKIPTGIRVWIEDGWFLGCFPRSSLGFKYRLQLDNTVGIIDSDYYNADNEGHIFAKITNDTNSGRCIHVDAGDNFIQGIFLEYGITVDDEANGTRTGGIGSTGR